jgi:outer membrane protein TolC
MTTTYAHVVTLALMLLMAAPAFAQDRVTLTVGEAVRRGLEHAPRLAEARARARAAGSTAEARAALARPTVSVGGGILRTNHVDEFGILQPNGQFTVLFPDIPMNYRYRAEVGVPVYTGGRVGALVDAARADERATTAEGAVAAADVELDVIVSYWTLATGRERVRVLERAQARADAMVSDATARVDAGLLPPSDQLTAQAQRARQRIALIHARNDSAVAEAQLARLTGLPPGVAIDLATPGESASPSVVVPGTSVEALVARATAGRAERLALRERQAAAQAAGEAAVAARRPHVAALAAVEPSRPNARWVPRADRWRTSWDLGVNVTWSFWDGGRAYAERAAAVAQAEAIEARIADFDAAVGVEVRQRRLDVEAARVAIEAADEAVAAAAEARRVVGERFAVGVETSTQVLDSDLMLLEAEVERARLVGALRISEARLVRALGGHP